MATPVLAQSNLFLGWHMQAATGYQGVTPSLTNYSTSGAYTNSQTSQSMPLVLGAGFTFAISERQVLGLTYERNLLSINPAGQDYYTSSGLTSSTRMGFDNQAQWSLMLGQLIRNGSMVYGKLSYASLDTTDAANNFNLDGYGVGIGFKTFLNPFQYVYTEYNYTKMSERSIQIGSDSFKASAVGKGGLVGIGWQF
jgi:outer membrane immunogenic protein